MTTICEILSRYENDPELSQVQNDRITIIGLAAVVASFANVYKDGWISNLAIKASFDNANGLVDEYFADTENDNA